MEIKNCWTLYNEAQLNELEELNAKYRTFLDNGKTERECVDEIVNTIEAAGYRELEALIEKGEVVKEGDKVYSVCMNKAVVMYHIGSKPMTAGMNILGAHIDSPRIDIKQNPVFEQEGFVHLNQKEIHQFCTVLLYTNSTNF
jgi:aspartyl aminopeptidase